MCGGPAQVRQRFLERLSAAVRMGNKLFVCSCLWGCAVDEGVAACHRVAIQHSIIRALQDDRGLCGVE